jgi:hypothetical protein
MQVGDRVRFRDGSKAWKRLGIGPEPTGYVVEVYYDPDARSSHKADVKFPGAPEPERAINAEDLEVVADEQGAEDDGQDSR